MTLSLSKSQIGYVFVTSLLSMLLAAALYPAGLKADVGLSIFGVHWISLLPYIIAMALNGVGQIASSRILAIRYNAPVLRPIGIMMAVCLAILVVTPYSISVTVHVVHDSFGSALFVIQLLVAMWLTFYRHSLFEVILVLLLLVAGITALFSLLALLQFEVPGQLIFQALYFTIFWRHLEPPQSETPKPEELSLPA